jgi:hypothetical protein
VPGLLTSSRIVCFIYEVTKEVIVFLALLFEFFNVGKSAFDCIKLHESGSADVFESGCRRISSFPLTCHKLL